ncbi:hypothetical protein ACPV50_09600 [Vibrio astriarenae]
MGRKGNVKGWIKGTAKQEAWLDSYLTKKKISFQEEVVGSTTPATDYLKDLDDSDAENWRTIHQAGNAWRALTSRKNNKLATIAMSKETHQQLKSLAKANKASIRYIVDLMVADKHLLIEVNEENSELKSKLKATMDKLIESDVLVSELRDEIEQMKVTIDELTQKPVNLVSPLKEAEKHSDNPTSSELKLHPKIAKMVSDKKIEAALKYNSNEELD